MSTLMAPATKSNPILILPNEARDCFAAKMNKFMNEPCIRRVN